MSPSFRRYNEHNWHSHSFLTSLGQIIKDIKASNVTKAQFQQNQVRYSMTDILNPGTKCFLKPACLLAHAVLTLEFSKRKADGRRFAAENFSSLKLDKRRQRQEHTHQAYEPYGFAWTLSCTNPLACQLSEKNTVLTINDKIKIPMCTDWIRLDLILFWKEILYVIPYLI